MANWTTLKTAIADAIRTNGNQEITGQVLQNVLTSIVSTIGRNATFAGVATPETNPGVPDGPVFYLARASGIYINFGVTVQNEIAIITSTSGNSWAKQTVLGLATINSTGLMSAEDKAKLDTINAAELDTINAKLDVLYKVALGWSEGGKDYKKGTTWAPSVTWTVKVNGQPVSPTLQKIKVGSGSEVVLDNNVRTYSVGSITSDTTVTLTVDGTTLSASFKFHSPAYLGTVAGGTTITESIVKSLTELTNYGKKGYTQPTAFSNVGSACVLYAYPLKNGALTSIKSLSATGFNLLPDFERGTIKVNGEDYYYYLLKKESVQDNIRYEFT